MNRAVLSILWLIGYLILVASPLFVLLIVPTPATRGFWVEAVMQRLFRLLLLHTTLAGMLCGLLTAAAWGQPPGYSVYRGCVHIHSVYSDGSGTFPEIIAAGQQAGLDFIITSDHNTLQPRIDGYEGWHENLLTLIGVEISTDAGHYFAMQVPSDFRWPGNDAQQVIDAVNAAGGMGFIAHPVSRWEWRDWSVTGFAGLEIINQSSIVHRSFETQPLRALGQALTDILRGNGSRVLERAYRVRPSGPLDVWIEESLARRRQLVTIGSVDAHALMIVGSREIKLPTYEQSFNSLQTHVITPTPFTRDYPADRALIYDAIRQGHCYTIYAIRGKALGFWFQGWNGQETAIMGDQLPLRNGVTLEARVPPHTEELVIRLYRNGQQLTNTRDDVLTHTVTEPGIYHIEVNLVIGEQRWPWIISNPVYVAPNDGPAWEQP